MMQTSEKIHPDQIESSSNSVYRDIGPYKGYDCRDHHVTVYGDKGNLTLMMVTPDIIRVSSSLRGGSAEIEPSSALLPFEPLQGWKVIELGDHIEFELIEGNISLHLDLKTMDLSVRTIKDKQTQGKECGTYKLSFSDTHFRCQGNMEDHAVIYGLGETTGYLNKRGERYTMWNSDVFDPHVPDMESLYQSIPLLIHHTSDKSFGVFIDSPGKTVIDLRAADDSYSIETDNGILDLYFITGAELKDIVGNYSLLTGKMPLPPLWSLGYQQSRFSYMNQDEVMELAHNFRNKQIPCDVIYLDIHYMTDYKVFTFDPERFPDPAGMMKELKELGIRIVPIVDPGVKIQDGYEVYEQGIQAGRFCQTPDGDNYVGDVWPGPSVFPDFTDKDTRVWWGALHQFYVDFGISGIWNDMNEPSVFNSPTKTMDANVIHRNEGDPKTHGELHNIYGMLMCQSTYEGLEKLLQGERPFVLTRAGYAGIQRYAAVWTGDNRSYWEHMKLSMSMGLNLGLSGVAFTGSDIGGFMHHASGELLARWTQLGVFTPFCRNHSAIDTRNQEPWTFNSEVEEVCRQYIQLRYRMLPYMYSLFYNSTRTGLPIMRPLVLEYPSDPQTFNLNDQFLLGKDLLVAPICEPGKEHRVVYLPEGTWYDYWNGIRYEGKSHILVHAPLNVLPLFVKAGAIIPQTKLAQHTGQGRWNELEIHVYGGGKSDAVVDHAQHLADTFLLYEDDGLTDAYKQGVYNAIKLMIGEDERRFTIQASYEADGLGQANSMDESGRSMTFIIHHLSFIPKSVNQIFEVDDRKHLEQQGSGWYYDKQDNQLYIKLQVAALQEVDLIVEG